MVKNEDYRDITGAAIDAFRVDLTLLAGREATLYTEQFPGQPLKATIALANDREVHIDRGTSAHAIDNLASGQKVVVRVGYKGQHLSLPAVLNRVDGHRYRIALGKKLLPLTRRKYARIDYRSPVKLALMSATTFQRSRLGRLRWLETVTINISSGGSLIDFNTCLVNPTYLFFHLQSLDFSFPSLLLAQVVYSLPLEDAGFRVGLRFIVKEAQPRHFPPATIKELPPVVHEYGEAKRTELDQEIVAWVQANPDDDDRSTE